MSAGEVEKCTPETWLSKEPEMAAIGAAVAERFTCKLELDFTAFSLTSTWEDSE